MDDDTPWPVVRSVVQSREIDGRIISATLIDDVSPR